MSKVMTVRGPISPDKLGITYMHAHVLLDIVHYCVEPEEASIKSLMDAPITMENLGDIRRNMFGSRDNLRLGDIDLAVKELMEFKRMGGNTIVETCPIGAGRDPLGCKKISNETGLNIICASGWYIASTHPSYIKKKSVDDLCSIMVHELTEGMNETDIKAGIIKIACSGFGVPFEEEEKKILQAAARAQSITEVPFTLHPNTLGSFRGLNNTYLQPKTRAQTFSSYASTYLDIIEEEGGNLKKFYISHMSNWAGTLPLELKKPLLDRGITFSYDGLGMNVYWSRQVPAYSTASDREQVRDIIELINNGYEKQIVISTEICMKVFCKKYGGYGYAHVLEHIVPELKYDGVTNKQINCMLVENPKRLFS